MGRACSALRVIRGETGSGRPNRQSSPAPAPAQSGRAVGASESRFRVLGEHLVAEN